MTLKSLRIDRKSGLSTSIQIENFLREQIISREVLPGEKLPTTSEITGKVKVSPQTVRQAISRLEKEGLVSSTPGRGTFVLDPKHSQQRSGLVNVRSVKRVAVAGSFYPEKMGGWYRRLSVSGIARQCYDFGADVMVLSQKMNNESPSKICEHLWKVQSDGIIWLYPEPEYWQTIEGLVKAQVPLVVLRRSHGRDNICSVEIDYEIVGFDAAQYFIDNGCEKILLVTYGDGESASEDGLKNGLEHGSWPSNVTQGFSRAFTYFKGASDGRVETCVLGGYKQTAVKMREVLASSGKDCGLFFVDAMQLLDYLISCRSEALEQLAGRKIIVITNRDNYNMFLPYVRELDLRTFMEVPELLGVLAVQKLANLLNGSMENTCTLFKPDTTLEKFSATKLVYEAITGKDFHKR